MSQSKQAWLIRYHYDPLDQITSHTLSSTPTRHRFYCKKRLTTEIQGAIGYCIVQHGDLLLAQQQHLQDVHDTTLLATDLQRSALHTLKKNTQTQPIAYSPYGYRSVANGLLSLLGFNGERPDPVTGHYLLGNYRAFNPVLMRFNSPDSLSPFGKGGLNAYGYCMGDPINHSDRNGHFALPNFLSKLFERVKNSLGRPTKSVHFVVDTAPIEKFQSGPTRTFTNAIETVNQRKYATSTGRETVTDYWSKKTKLEDFTGVISTSEVHGQHGFIHGNHNEINYFRYRSTPSLKELAYKSVPGNKLEDLGIKAPWMNESNFYNAFTEFLNSRAALSNRHDWQSRNMIRDQLLERIRKGEVMGVHPSYQRYFI